MMFDLDEREQGIIRVALAREIVRMDQKLKRHRKRPVKGVSLSCLAMEGAELKMLFDRFAEPKERK